MVVHPITTYPRLWGTDILVALLFVLTTGMLWVVLGTRSEVEAVPAQHSQKHAVAPVKTTVTIAPQKTKSQELADPFLPATAPVIVPRKPAKADSSAPVSLESQRRILKIINGDQ